MPLTEPTLAILGGGQLGRMLGLAAIPLGYRCRFLDPNPESPALVAGDLLVGAYDDEARLAELTDGAEVVTYEFENVPASAAHWLESHATVRPGPAALEVAQDRLREREKFRELGIASPRSWKIDSVADLEAASKQLGGQGLLKTRRMGYDGKGQQRVQGPSDAQAAFDAIKGQPSILDEMIPFERELSVVAVRGVDGDIRCYPICENVHAKGILQRTIAPTRVDDAVARDARDAAAALMESLDYVGVLALEFFDAGGTLLANEFAPRVHNTGHWTTEGALTSQFENHVRAVCGLPLGETGARGPSAMINLLGDIPSLPELLAIRGVHVHIYGKAPRPGRKVGHVTIELPEDETEAAALIGRVEVLAGFAPAGGESL